MKPIAGRSETPARRQRRVAYVVHTFDMGGLERCVARLINRLDPQRFEPVLVCLDRDGNASDWIEREGVPVVELHKRRGNDLGLVGRLAWCLRKHGIDIVHSHNWGTLLETSLARRSARTPVHVHAERGTLLGAVDSHGLRAWLRAGVARWAMNRSDCIVTVAESLAKKVRSRCGPLWRPIKVIPNGVDVPAVTADDEELARMRSSLGISADATLLGSVGRLVPVKDFGNAIDAISQLRPGADNVHLVLVGDGPERESLAKVASERGVEDRVHLVGHQDDIGDWLAIMNVYLNVSLSEGMSQSILEAMASGLPMVVTDVGDSAAMINGDHPCGLVAPAGDPLAVAGAVRELLDDPTRQAAFRQNALARHADCYNLEKMVQTYERLYTDLLDLR